MVVADVLEWFQCKSCGRRHRWRADLAGKSTKCSCGQMVVCPDVDFGNSSSAGTGHETVVETADRAHDPSFDQSFLNGDGAAGANDYVPPPRMGKGLFGLSVQGEFVFWSVMSLLGLAMLIHAIITTFWWYIAAAVLIAPLSFWQWHRAKRIWQGPRKFWTAVEKSLGG